MTRLQAIRKFADIVAGEHVICSYAMDMWAMSMIDSHPRLMLPRNLFENDEDDKLFRKDFIKRCPMARGFANVTLSILHEIGHHFHREEYIFTDYEVYERANGAEHFKIPCEIVATNWAIEWLQDPFHRKIAKAFEHEFFGAVR